MDLGAELLIIVGARYKAPLPGKERFMADVFKVLSIDGGGLRGIIPAMVLTEIEERTRRAITETFDLIAGTSTGGMLALGLVMPGDGSKPRYTAKELIGIYEEQGAHLLPAC